MTLEFDDIVRAGAPSSKLADDWRRQRNTARELCDRLARGLDTQLLADEVGMGKTYVAMAALANTLLREGGRALLVTPSSAILRAKWEQEIRSFSSTYIVPAHPLGALRPLVVRDYWDLLSNLHDHDNNPLGAVHVEKLRCVLLALRTYAVRKGWLTNRHAGWEAMQGLTWTDPPAMAFKSDYSIAAWEAFLDLRNTQENGQVQRLVRALTAQRADASRELKAIRSLFREFTARQGEFEPNILILGMGSLARRPRLDSLPRQQFASFVLACLLRGRWAQTRTAVVRAVRPLVGALRPADLDAIAQTNLYRSADCVARVLSQDQRLWDCWDRICAAPRDARDMVHDFFATLLDRVVAEKLRESGIRLAVVDEAHNWKSGANGATRFRDIIAPAIPHKILMSATPFQLEETEMRQVFRYAMKPEGEVDGILAQLFDGGSSSLVTRCVRASHNFEVSLAALESDEVSGFAKVCDVPKYELKRSLDQAESDPLKPARLRQICRQSLDYRAALDKVVALQRKFIIRHLKDRSHRAFHAGIDFGRQIDQPHHALYPVFGLWDANHEFVNYMAMRLDQRVRSAMPGQQGKDTSAHLMRGLSSSRSAFKASHEQIHSQVAQASQALRRALDRFQRAVDSFDHPKVNATVELALRNYLHGRKTLIFCERIPTVVEISSALRARIDGHWETGTLDHNKVRRSILEDTLFTDVHLYRSWCRAHRMGQVADPTSSAAREYVRNALAAGQAPATERRVLRLLDLWAILQHVAHSEQTLPFSAQLLVVLAEGVQKGDPVLLESVLNVTSTQASLSSDVNRVHDKVAAAWQHRNLWVEEGPSDSASFDDALWALLDDEARRLMRDCIPIEPATAAAFQGVLVELQSGMRKVALRSDLLKRYLRGASGSRNDAVYAGLRSKALADTAWDRLIRFLQALCSADGSINPRERLNTQRRSLWRGVNLKPREDEEDRVVATITAGVDAETRVTVCAAFNSPLAPDVLVCTAIGSEGIDLHRECAEVVHHDLPWNPARLEQRIGRIDRVNSLAEVSGERVKIGIPFLANDYEQFQYNKVLSRAQLFEVLMGRPDFESLTDEEVSAEEEGSQVKEVDADADADANMEAPAPRMPNNLAMWLRPDFSLRNSKGSTQRQSASRPRA